MKSTPLPYSVAILALLLSVVSAQAGELAAPETVQPLPGRWDVDFSTGALWKVDSTAEGNYTILPQMLAVRTPSLTRPLLGGTFFLRGRLALLAEVFVEGAEDYYFGFSLGPSLEWADASEDWRLFLALGAGYGLLNSKVSSGERFTGRDGNFNLFWQIGTERRMSERFAVSLSLYYQHLSNGDQTTPNNGLNTFGPMVGFHWDF